MRNYSQLVTALLAMAASGAAAASDFEYCELTGTVESARLQRVPRARDFEFTLLLTAAHRQPGVNGQNSYTDCKDRIGKKLEVRLQLPKRYGTPRTGDHVRINWSAVDGFSADGGYAGTTVTTELLEYSAASSSSGS